MYVQLIRFIYLGDLIEIQIVNCFLITAQRGLQGFDYIFSWDENIYEYWQKTIVIFWKNVYVYRSLQSNIVWPGHFSGTRSYQRFSLFGKVVSVELAPICFFNFWKVISVELAPICFFNSSPSAPHPHPDYSCSADNLFLWPIYFQPPYFCDSKRAWQEKTELQQENKHAWVSLTLLEHA